MHIQQMRNFLNRHKSIVVLAVLLLCTLGVMESMKVKSVLRIEGTGRKDADSYGTDIRINEIYVNDMKLTAGNVTLKGNWDTSNDHFIIIGSDESTWIEIPFCATDQVTVKFWEQCGCGYINIIKDGELVEERDLYAPEYEATIFLQEQTAQITPLQEWLPFIALAEGLILEYLVLRALLWKRKTEMRECNKRYGFLHPLLLAFGASVLHLCAEWISGNLLKIPLIMAAENMLLYFSVMLIVYIITARVSWSVGVVSFAWLIFAIANYYVTEFRGSPITPGDFLVIKTAAEVAGNYRYDLTKHICCGLIAFIFCFAVISRLEEEGSAWSGKRKVLLCVPTIVLACVVTMSDIYCKDMDLWNLKTNLAKYGLGVNMVSTIHNMQLDAPQDFSAEKATEILSQYEQEDNGFHPNIVVVMNEAFSDLSVVDETMDSDLYMPYFNSLKENTVKGTLISSVYGGTTANSEYEFLTGNSMFFMKNHVPYQQHVFWDTYSLVGELKDRGYSAVAVHPYLASGYNRPRVYSCFGFDKFLSIDDFSDYELVRNRYISDRDSYKKVIEAFEEITGDRLSGIYF